MTTLHSENQLQSLRSLKKPPLTPKHYRTRSNQANLVKLKRFWCNGIVFKAYQLNNKDIVFNDTQMLPNRSKLIRRLALEFIQINDLKTIQGTLPNRIPATIYPLATVVAFWDYLDSIGKLPDMKKSLLSAFFAHAPIKEEWEYLAKREDWKIQVLEGYQAAPILAKAVTLQLSQELQLQVLVCGSNYYIADSEGLRAIGTSPTWLEEVNMCQRKAQTLKRRGFTGDTHLLQYKDRQGDAFQTHARPWIEWLSIWDYFSTMGNNKSAAILRCLATQGIGERIGSAESSFDL